MPGFILNDQPKQSTVRNVLYIYHGSYQNMKHHRENYWLEPENLYSLEKEKHSYNTNFWVPCGFSGV